MVANYLVYQNSWKMIHTQWAYCIMLVEPLGHWVGLEVTRASETSTLLHKFVFDISGWLWLSSSVFALDREVRGGSIIPYPHLLRNPPSHHPARLPHPLRSFVAVFVSDGLPQVSEFPFLQWMLLIRIRLCMRESILE